MTVQQQSSLSGTASNLRKNPSMTHNTNRFEHEVWTATAFCRSRGVVTTEQRGREVGDSQAYTDTELLALIVCRLLHPVENTYSNLKLSGKQK